jgi:two-component system, NarL family, nitrate/nitrite response regulator NarL
MTAQRFSTRLDQTHTPVSGLGPEASTALICDSPVLRAELQHILAGTPLTVAEGFSAAWPTLVSGRVQEPTLVIFAANRLPSSMLKMVQRTKERFPAARIVVLADYFDLRFVRHGRDAGVEGFCLIGSSRSVLITSLELVRLGEPVLPSTLVRGILDELPLRLGPKLQNNILADPKPADPRLSSLSAREAAILTCLIEGASNKAIARKFDLAEGTVKVHMKAILRKIGMANRTQAAIWAAEHLPHEGESLLNA